MSGHETPEGRVVRKILDYLNALPRCTARKTHGGPYQQAGEPDIDGVLDGRALKVEVKLPGTEHSIRKRITPLQAAALKRYARCGAITGVVVSVEEMDGLLRWKGLVPSEPTAAADSSVATHAARVRARLD